MIRGWLAVIGVFLAAFATFIGFWVGVFALVNHFGFDIQTTPQYGFSSGVGPMILAALGYSTIVAGLWHGLNCHHPGCPRIGRHRVNGTPWCTLHHQKARPAVSDSERLDRIITLLEESREQ
jgi:hypothetical protein